MKKNRLSTFFSKTPQKANSRLYGHFLIGEVSNSSDAIAAAVIGGTSTKGGVGTMAGTFIGALLIGVINNGLDLMNVTSYYQQVIMGIIIISAVLLDSWNQD